jgi:uncharacterized protein YdeI (BOF family)
MKKTNLLLTLALLGVFVIAQNLVAGGAKATKYDKDPDSNKWHITTVRWIKGTHNDLKNDDRYVVLIGKITKKIDGDTYLLNDDTGTVELDSDIELPQGKYIVVRGVIDQAWLNMDTSDYDGVEIEVKSWRFDKDVAK